MKSYTDESINIIKDAIPEEAKCYEWPPIGNNIDLPTLPDFPLHALPQVIRNMADEISKAVKVPASLAAAEILGLVGLAIGRNVHYCFKRSLTGRANLYMLIFAARGERKSSVDSIVQKPFREWLEIQSREYQKQLEKADILQKRLDFLIGKLIKGRIVGRDEEEISSDMSSGTLKKAAFTAISHGIKSEIGSDEVALAQREFPEFETAQTEVDSCGPGNVLLAKLEYENITELFSVCGEFNQSRTVVAKRVIGMVKSYQKYAAPVWRFLADQLLLPMALGAGGKFLTVSPSQHTETNIAVIRKFMNVQIDVNNLQNGQHIIEVKK